MPRRLVFFVCVCGGLLIPQCLWGQDYCANEDANRSRLQQWVNYDRANNKTTLQFNQTQLADAEKAWKACQLKEFGAAPKVTAMDDGELLTFPNGTCFKPRDFAKDVKAEGTVKVKEIFDGHLSYEQKLVAVGQVNPTTKQVSDALFLSCLDLVQQRITLQMYQDNKKAYEEVRDFKRVSKVRDISSGQINVGCNTGANTETSVLQIGKSPMNYASR